MFGIRINWFLCLSIFSVDLMSFVAITAFSWTSPFLPKLTGKYDPDSNPLAEPATLLEETWIANFISIGSLCGPLFIGPISSRIGKKMTLVILSIPVLISNIILIFANTVAHFYVSRFLVGLGMGCVFCVIPPFVAELTNVSDRGKAQSFMILMNSIAHLCVVSIGPYVTIRTYAYFSLVPSILFFIIFLPFVPESPYYYLSRNNPDGAEKSLKKLRQTSDVKLELINITESFEKIKINGSLKDIFRSKAVLKGLFLTIGLMFFQQLSGAQPLNAYLQKIFHSTRSTIPSEIAVIIVGAVQLFGTFFTVILIDKLGRRFLLLSSFSCTLISLSSFCIYFFLQDNNIDVDSLFWLPTVSTCLFRLAFKFGVGPVPWSIVGEIFPVNLKIYLSAIVTCSWVIFGFSVTFMFPLMFAYIGQSWTFFTFAVFTIGSLLFTYFMVPEIKGKSFLEIQDILNNKSSLPKTDID